MCLKYLHLNTSPLRASANKAPLSDPVCREWRKVLSVEVTPTATLQETATHTLFYR